MANPARIAWRLPPVWVRRCIIAPLVVLLAFVWLPIAIWVGVVVAGIVSLAFPGKLRLFRVFFMMGLYLLWDAFALVVMFVLWVISGFGLAIRKPFFVRAHYRLARMMLGSLFVAARWVLRLKVNIQLEDVEGVTTGHPMILVSRHAGPADSFIIVHALLSRFGREPAIVLKDTLQWDPAVDVLLNRVPSRFVTPTRQRKQGAPGGAAAIGELARGLDEDDALLIFPEGANATPRRRERRIAQLRDHGHAELADRAEAMGHVMPPHAGGVLAAMDARPDAVVVMVAHTGLERLLTVGDVWRELPVDKQITLNGWLTDPAEIPEGVREREAWLYDWWEKIDAWIDANQPQAKSAETDSPE